jgi:hypothetical protein
MVSIHEDSQQATAGYHTLHLHHSLLMRTCCHCWAACCVPLLPSGACAPGTCTPAAAEGVPQGSTLTHALGALKVCTAFEQHIPQV